MNIGAGLLGLFLVVLIGPMLFDFNTDRPYVIVLWAASLLVLAIVSATFFLRGRGIRD